MRRRGDEEKLRRPESHPRRLNRDEEKVSNDLLICFDFEPNPRPGATPLRMLQGVS